MYAICVEASHPRGMGHLFRGLALAQALEQRGCVVRIYANEDIGAHRVLESSGLPWAAVPLRADDQRWIAARVRADKVRVWIDDCFETSLAHAQAIQAAGIRRVTFSDRGSGAALADLHICAVQLGEESEPAGRRVLRGLQYLVLDPEVARHRRLRTELRRIVVSMGGSDTYGLTTEVMRALAGRRMPATVVLGPGFVHEAELAAVAQGFEIKRSVGSLPAEFARHDLAITAGGMTPFEANAAGLPCIVVGAEPWEERAGRMLAALGGCIYAGPRDRVDYSVLDSEVPVRRMSEAALAAVPADGAARVAAEIAAL